MTNRRFLIGSQKLESLNDRCFYAVYRDVSSDHSQQLHVRISDLERAFDSLRQNGLISSEKMAALLGVSLRDVISKFGMAVEP